MTPQLAFVIGTLVVVFAFAILWPVRPGDDDTDADG